MPTRSFVGRISTAGSLSQAERVSSSPPSTTTRRATVHANGADETLVRLEGMALLAGIPLDADREQVAAALDLVVVRAVTRPSARSSGAACGRRDRAAAAPGVRRAPVAERSGARYSVPRRSPGGGGRPRPRAPCRDGRDRAGPAVAIGLIGTPLLLAPGLGRLVGADLHGYARARRVWWCWSWRSGCSGTALIVVLIGRVGCAARTGRVRGIAAIVGVVVAVPVWRAVGPALAPLAGLVAHHLASRHGTRLPPGAGLDEAVVPAATPLGWRGQPRWVTGDGVWLSPQHRVARGPRR